MEAYSVEDQGGGILFNVFCYNAQPGVNIDYATGESSSDGAVAEPETSKQEEIQKNDNGDGSGGNATYILNTNTSKFHNPNCSSVNKIKDSNKQEYTGNRDDLISQGYDPCKRCNP